MTEEAPERLNAALEGRYRIERELGQGGMAAVFLAEDVRHHRKVALKVLKPELAAVVGGERFLAEIEVTANLQHPHILPLFDSGQADGFLFYVMPYVEGESLRDKLDRERQLPVEEALRIAKAVASGLDYAHRQGVVHRDIKPANILLQDGEPVIADFGIALAVQQAGGGRLTETGLSLGTPYYMSPEQATADRDPGARSDVYSLGCVLYEMLTGEPPFPGSSAQQVLGKILTSEPTRPTEIRKTIPPHVEAVILRALQKLPADRFGSAADLARALDEPAMAGFVPPPGTGEATPAISARGLRSLLPWAVTALALILLVASWVSRAGNGGRGGNAPAIRAVLQLPDDAAVTYSRVAISRDGRVVAVGGTWNGQSTVLVRPMDELEFRPVAGTEDAEQGIFLSPDGRWLGYSRGGAMLKVPLSGGPPVLMDPDATWAGGDWGEDGTVVYSRRYQSGLYRVDAEGGEPVQLTQPADGELAHWWPQILPDGEHVLFTAYRTPIQEARISVLSLETGERKDLLKGGVDARYVPTGHLLFARGEALYAVPFDTKALEVTGDAVPVVEGVAMQHSSGLAAYDLSDRGTLVYVPAEDMRPPLELVWVDRQGREEPVVAAEDRYTTPALSPDARSLAVAISERAGAEDVWVLDLLRGTRTRITSGAGADFAPVWSPSGRTIVYVSEQPVFDLYRRPADASEAAASLVRSPFDKYPSSFTPDGDTLVFTRSTLPTVSTSKVPLTGGEPEPVYAPDFNVRRAVLSPDGRWLAYDSDESGTTQVYMSPYGEPTRLRRQVSTDGGMSPLWTRRGRELVYRRGSRVMSVAVDPETGELDRPEVLFEGPYAYSALLNPINYDVTPDGERFLMIKRPPDAVPRRVVVVTGFFHELRALGQGGG